VGEERTTADRLPVGSTVIRREVYRDRLLAAYPTRVLEHSARRLMVVHWPGVDVLVPKTWTAWLRGAGDAVREQAIANLARGTWELDRWTWQATTWVTMLLPDRWFSVDAVFEDESGAFRGWYVNFERPYRRVGASVETFDLLVDLVVAPDLAVRWKDEAEYRQAHRLGVISDAEVRRVEAAREDAVGRVRGRLWPFDERWDGWHRQIDWPVPALPPDVAAWSRDGGAAGT